jgi:hypothetical protein
VFTLSKPNKLGSSRRQIQIKGVRDGILLLPKHDYCLAFEVSSINFELMSEDEQDAMIDTYQNFLNSLSTPFQIVVRIREMDMDRYLDSFRARVEHEEVAVYKTQNEAYMKFVKRLVSSNKIMTRKFYVVVPHSSSERDFSIIKEQLELTGEIVTKGLARLGMQTRKLTSLELLDLFYSFYAPAQSKRQPLKAATIALLEKVYT